MSKQEPTPLRVLGQSLTSRLKARADEEGMSVLEMADKCIAQVKDAMLTGTLAQETGEASIGRLVLAKALIKMENAHNNRGEVA